MTDVNLVDEFYKEFPEEDPVNENECALCGKRIPDDEMFCDGCLE